MDLFIEKPEIKLHDAKAKDARSFHRGTRHAFTWTTSEGQGEIDEDGKGQ